MLRSLALALCDVGAGVLALAGLIKFFDPHPWVASLRSMGVPMGRPRMQRWAALAARFVGVAEVAIAVAIVFFGRSPAYAALVVAYVLFVLVAAVATRRGGASCGCFGVRSAPVSSLHVVLNLVVAAAAVVGTIDAAAPLVDRLDEGLGAAVGYVAFLGLGMGAMVTAMTTGAELLAVRRSVRPLAARASR